MSARVYGLNGLCHTIDNGKAPSEVPCILTKGHMHVLSSPSGPNNSRLCGSLHQEATVKVISNAFKHATTFVVTCYKGISDASRNAHEQNGTQGSKCMVSSTLLPCLELLASKRAYPPSRHRHLPQPSSHTPATIIA